MDHESADAWIRLRALLKVDGRPAEPERVVPTFAEFSARWFETCVKANNRPAEQEMKALLLRRHLLPCFGARRLDEISLLDIESYKGSKVREGLKEKTINNHLAVLSACLRDAREEGVITASPRIRFYRVLSVRTNYLTIEEAGRLLADTTEPVIHDMVLVALDTGLRRGEILGLRWDDIDFDNSIIAVHRSIVLGRVQPPKNGRTRYVPMTSDLATRLSLHRRRTGYIFGTTASPMHWKSAIRGLERLCARTGVRKIGWHTLRHTCATLLAQNSYPLHAIQQILGHGSITTTMRYAHVAPSLLWSAATVLQDARERATARSVAAGRQYALERRSPASFVH